MRGGGGGGGGGERERAMPNENSRKNGKQIVESENKPSQLLCLGIGGRKKQQLDEMEYMVLSLKRRCVERCKQKCMAQKAKVE